VPARPAALQHGWAGSDQLGGTAAVGSRNGLAGVPAPRPGPGPGRGAAVVAATRPVPRRLLGRPEPGRPRAGRHRWFRCDDPGGGRGEGL